MVFIKTKGCLYLSIEPNVVQQYLNQVDLSWQANREKRDGLDYHITVVRSCDTIDLTLNSTPPNENYYIVGLKKVQGVAFLVVHYPAGDKFRRKNSLPDIDFHISLGWAKEDNHSICKSIKILSCEDIINKSFWSNVTVSNKQLDLMNKMYEFFPSDPDILAGYIDSLCKVSSWVLASKLSYSLLDLDVLRGLYALIKINSHLNTLNSDLIKLIEEKIQGIQANSQYTDYIIEKLNRWALANSGHIVLKQEWVNYNGLITKINKPRNCTEPYSKIFGSAVVKSSHLEYLKYKSIHTIISLVEPKENIVDSELLGYFGSKYISFPIPDRHIVSLEQTDAIIEKMIEIYDSNNSTLIHCMGGKGRTNMIICCFAIKKLGLKYNEICDHLRTSREFILSREQIDLIKRYELSLAQNPDFNKKDKSFIKYGRYSCPKMLVLVGLPGSGKSTFSKHLVDNVKQIIRVSQDDIGKKACYEKIGSSIQSNSLIIVDRCNLKAGDRKEFCDYLRPGQKAWSIQFNTDADECVYRAQHRPDHPTLKASGAEKIIKGLELSFEPVNLALEQFEQLIQIKSPDDLNYILEQWGLPPIECEPINNNLNTKTGDIIKFPRTRHLANIGGASREDLLLEQSEINYFLASELYIEEKIDGANMGISIDPSTYTIKFQNRSHYVTSSYAAQFKKLDAWKDAHQTELFDILEPGVHILYGEWVYSKHSIHYNNLPGYFIAFDLFDIPTGKFASRNKLEELLAKTSIPLIRLVTKGKFKSMDQIVKLVDSKSAYYDGKLEGIYIRVCDEFNTLKRAKIVRSDFICGDTHWSKSKCTENLLSIKL